MEYSNNNEIYLNKLYESLDGYLQIKQSKNSKSFVDFFLKVIKKY